MAAVRTQEGSPAIIVHRGEGARRLRELHSDRIIPSRCLNKWKDMGDNFNLDVDSKTMRENGIPEHSGPKSRWILQGFHDPDIAELSRSVPTPETADVPLCLQLMASMQAKAFVADVSQAFSQGVVGQRKQPLFASPLPGRFPGEHDDVLVEIRAEIYGLVSGPPRLETKPTYHP